MGSSVLGDMKFRRPSILQFGGPTRDNDEISGWEFDYVISNMLSIRIVYCCASSGFYQYQQEGGGGVDVIKEARG